MLAVKLGMREADPPWLRALLGGLCDGINKYGDHAQIIHPRDLIADADVTICWGIGDAAWHLLTVQQQRGCHHLVMEYGYLGDRRTWVSLGWNGLNGRATFPVCRDNGQRFYTHFGHLLQPWRADVGDGYVLVVGQVETDRQIRHPLRMTDFKVWASDVVKTLHHLGLADIHYRPHPLAKDPAWCPDGAVLVHGPSVLTDAINARFVVTYNSNSGVEAVLYGVPTVTMDEGAMAWDVTSHNLAQPFVRPDRTMWAHNLAWAQWQVEELQSGVAWDVLKEALYLHPVPTP